MQAWFQADEMKTYSQLFADDATEVNKDCELFMPEFENSMIDHIVYFGIAE